MVRNNLKNPIRVLRIIARLNIGGPAIHTILLSTGLPCSRYETCLITGREDPEEGNMEYLFPAGFQPARLNDLRREIDLVSDIRLIWQLMRYIYRFQPHIIHTHTAKAGFVGRLSGFLINLLCGWNIKLVHTFHGHVFHGYFSPRKTAFFIWIEQILARITDIIIAITPLQLKEIQSHRVGRPRQFRQIPLGLDLAPFFRQERYSGDLYRLLKIERSRFIIGTVARLAPIKNLELFVSLAAEYRSLNHKIAFVIIGDGSERRMLEKMAAERQLENILYFAGFQRNLERFYADMGVMVLTSKNEGSPVAVIEAMTSGVPVVASRVGGVPDLFALDQAYGLADPAEPSTFAQAINMILDDPVRAETIAAHHRRRVFKLYDYSNLLSNMDHLYQELSHCSSICC